MPTPDLHHTATTLAQMLAFHCVRNSYLEELHAGMYPSSKTGDYTDVKVISPYGEIAWNRVSRISDEEMQRLSEDIVNRLYTFLFYLLMHGELDWGMPLPQHWSSPHIEASIAEMWPEGRSAASDAQNASQSDVPMLISFAMLVGPRTCLQAVCTRVLAHSHGALAQGLAYSQ